MSTIVVRAFAKINLSLRITATRADGFHEVQTILQAIDLADRLTGVSRRGPFQIVCRDPRVPVDRTNLVWRAARRLWRAAGRDGEPRNAMVTLEKRIPMQAGLGGGSSDAAAALFALRRVWRLRVTDDELFAIAAGLGSDVPFFLVGGTALGLGRGEELIPLADLPRAWVVLAVPPFGIATADAYAWFDARRARALTKPRVLPGTWLGRTVPLVNDLEPPVVARHPVVGTLMARLGKLGAVMSAMSGSGSTVFGIFRTAGAADRAQRALRRAGTEALMARTLTRRQSALWR